MELPFAMADYGPSPSNPRKNLTGTAALPADDESLVTASSQGSLVQSDAEYYPIPRLVSAAPQRFARNTASSPLHDHARNYQQQSSENDDGLAEVLSQYGVSSPPAETEFTYVNVSEADDDDVDLVLASNDMEDEPFMSPNQRQREDILALLLSGPANGKADALVRTTELANQAVLDAAQARKIGNLQMALDAHAAAANLFKDAATVIRTKNGTSVAAFA